MTKKGNYEPYVKFDMPMNEVIHRVAQVPKGEIKEEIKAEMEKTSPPKDGEAQVALFKDKEIRKIFHHGEWYFLINDIIEALTDSVDPKEYIKKIRSRDKDLSEGWGQIVTPLRGETEGGKQFQNYANAEGVFRIIQSIPSPKAEPFKRWLAKVGYERLQEMENPEIAVKRAILNWQVQGRNDDWIEARLRSIVARHELTSEWKKRGIKEGIEYGALTNVISEETFAINTEQHKQVKGLKKHHGLRDHMTDLELVLTMLGEKSTAAIAQATDAQGFNQNKVAAKSGGKIAGDARKGLEAQLGQSIVSESNFLKGNRINDPQLLTGKKLKK